VDIVMIRTEVFLKIAPRIVHCVPSCSNWVSCDVDCSFGVHSPGRVPVGSVLTDKWSWVFHGLSWRMAMQCKPHLLLFKCLWRCFDRSL